MAAAPEMDPSDVRAYLDADVPLKAVWECSGLIAGVALVPIGLNLLGAFSLIAIVWLGLNFMFSGQIDLAQMISTVFLIGFAFAILDNYHYPSPVATPWGVSQGFPDLLGQQAILLNERLMGDGVRDFTDAFKAADDELSARQAAGVAALFGDPEDGYRETLEDEASPASETMTALDNILTSLWRRAMVWYFGTFGKVILWTIGWIIFAQYLWGFFALALLTLVGPLFIPFIVISQFDFLFWGWFKAMLTAVIYMITAGVLYVVSTAILLAPIQRLATMPFPTEAGGVVAILGFAFRTYFEFLPLVFMAIMAAFKVGALSGGFMSGGTPPASGLGRLKRNAESAMASPTTKRFLDAWRAGGSGGGASPVLSQRTAAGRAVVDVGRQVSSRAK